MKKFLVFAVIAAVAAVSCQKNEIPASDPGQGVPMKLIARIGDATKVTYEPDGNVLKANWEATETISVVTLNGSGELVAVDNFTSTGAAGRNKAEFTGTFTGGATPARVIVIYPALVYDGVQYYNTVPYTDYSGTERHALYNGEVGSMFIQGNFTQLKQTADNDASHLENYCIMSGVANTEDIKTNTLDATLSNHMIVLKVTATFPDALKGKTLSQMVINTTDDTDADKGWKRGQSWEYIDIPGNGGIWGAGSAYLSSWTLYSNIVIPATGVVTLYYVGFDFNDLDAGDKLKFTATVDATEYGPAVKTLASALSLDKGKIYRMTVTIP